MFERDAPYAMALGMSLDEYWYGDPFLLVTYRKYNALQKRKADEIAWLNGYYNYIGLKCALSAVFAKTESDVEPYPEMPLQAQKAMQDSIDEEERERRELLEARLYMETMLAVGKNWGQQ